MTLLYDTWLCFLHCAFLVQILAEFHKNHVILGTLDLT